MFRQFIKGSLARRNHGGGEARRVSFSASEASTSTAKKSRNDRSSKRSGDRFRRGRNDFDPARMTEVQDYRIFAATWNVGGKSPPRGLNLDEWLHSSPPADIYVLGFQEIVPLNAGNVLGTEDNIPAKKWVSLIRRTLNKNPGASGYGGYHTPSPVLDPVVELDADFEGSARRQDNFSLFHRRSFHDLSRSLRMDGDFMSQQPRLDRRFSVCDPVNLGGRPSDFDGNSRWIGSPDDENIDEEVSTSAQFSPFPYTYNMSGPTEENDGQSNNSRYCLVASKQMVGVFLTVWVRSEIRDDVRNLKVSCVGRGLMGYLGNKGSISVSMSLHQTSFCFICCHLTSGEKEGDELRRNCDVMEILRKTRFPRVHGTGDVKSPETILDHDRIIWLGDLNYRIALSYCSAKALVEMHNWKQLLEKDQLRIQRRYGRVFQGWKEGRIYFPPTYKYSFNSDRYAGEGMHSKEKRRTPAWCDRILWYGNGLNQLSYVRGESRFSDHRPVYSIFMAEVEIVHQRKRNMGYFSSRIEVEELLPHSQSYRGINFY
ncbi:type IV inositol polyphosphate 5-phosphatase 6 isoform X2 [Brachypodium distachyon]|uniref:type IV inositol polyphosphate 5-phosphatase 6 isoform X2 n=1 Tax=Brachypodium distachyon TaxID=15368 RepID=UPI000D0D7393|nr:type IV inositol polyphosphate 5-phosphatase 6 isoform X2 [Brachypodium distachyon]|eukprot:XP_024313457.1 type IV inositol polyphosphate 5-phosphatase 6 isoform X2 [Brachypodium distachyon]